MDSSKPKSLAEWISSGFGRVVVVSPHMDDAILSCGGLLNDLLPHIQCLTVTVCTGDPEGVDPQNPPHGIALPSLRRDEEVSALRALGCQLIQLDLLDAIYRRHPRSGDALYPTMQSVWSMPRTEDDAQKQLLKNRLAGFRDPVAGRPTLFVSPLGIGHHVDHILCTQVVKSLIADPDHLVLFEDFPYVVDQGAHVGVADSAEKALQRLGFQGTLRLEHECDTDKKISWILHYESQIDSIFGSHEEVRPLLMKNSKNGHTLERFWKVKTA